MSKINGHASEKSGKGLRQKPARLIWIWNTLELILQYNRSIGRRVYIYWIDFSAEGMRNWKKEKRKEIRGQRRWLRKNKPEYWIDFKKAVKMLRDA